MTRRFLMIKIIIPTFIKEKGILNDYILKDICTRSFNESSYTIEYEDRTNGRYIKLEKNNEVHYVCLSASEEEYKGRNSFLSQYLGTAFCRYEASNESNKKMEVYLLMKTEAAFLPYQKFIYRCCKTLQINLLNVEETIFPFSTYKEIKNVRSQTSDRNTGNNASYFSDTGDFIEFFAKCYGANGKESVFMAMVVKQLTDKKIVVYQVEDNGQRSLSNPDKEILLANGFEFGEDIIQEEFNRVNLNATEKDLRDQPAFRLNLFKKFGDKKCYLCDCDIDSLIIASHIHRVTDIKNDKTLTDDEKKKQIIDGDNGLWLCANHDKLFEYGLIYFDNQKLVISNRLNEEQRNFVKEITTEITKTRINGFMIAEDTIPYGSTSFNIQDTYFNENMKHYLELHKLRSEKKENRA